MSNRTTSVALTYGGAAWLVIFGVLVSWFLLKQSTVTANVDLPNIPTFVALNEANTTASTLVQKAEVAFAAGRVTRPVGDSALDYYRQQLTLSPEDQDAAAGLKRITSFLVNGAETALAREDWTAARDLAQQALALTQNNVAATSVINRIKEHDAILQWSQLAQQQMSNDNLTQPKGDNALRSYREILKLDPTHNEAKQGIELIAQRLASLAQSEAFADRTTKARALIQLARSIAPNAPGIEAAEQLTDEWTNLTKDQAVKEDIMAAAQASQMGVLLATDQPGQLGALDLYSAALEKDQGSEAAQAGIDFVLRSVVDRAWIQLANEDFEKAKISIDAVAAKGADVAAVRAELDFLQRRSNNRSGNFDDRDYIGISQLEIKRRVQPSVNKNIAGGSVELAFTVDEQGDVKDITVVEAHNPELGTEAASAVGRWKFAPYTIDGRAITVRTGMLMRIET